MIAPRKPDEGNNDVVDGIFDPTPPFDDVDGLQGNGMVRSEGDVNKLTFPISTQFPISRLPDQRLSCNASFQVIGV